MKLAGYEVVSQALATEAGDNIEMAAYPTKTIMHHGAGTIAVEGSMNGSDWGDLTGYVVGVATALTSLAADIPATIIENPLYLRVTSSGSTVVTIVGSGRGL